MLCFRLIYFVASSRSVILKFKECKLCKIGRVGTNGGLVALAALVVVLAVAALCGGLVPIGVALFFVCPRV